MDREASANYLAGVLAQWLTATGLDAFDDPGSLAEIIDDALLAVGVEYSDLATAEVTSNIAGYRLVLRYVGLLRVQSAYIKPDLALDGPQMSKRYGEVLKSLAEAVKAAKAAADDHITIDSGAWSITSISGNYLEPMVTT